MRFKCIFFMSCYKNDIKLHIIQFVQHIKTRSVRKVNIEKYEIRLMCSDQVYSFAEKTTFSNYIDMRKGGSNQITKDFHLQWIIFYNYRFNRIQIQDMSVCVKLMYPT